MLQNEMRNNQFQPSLNNPEVTDEYKPSFKTRSELEQDKRRQEREVDLQNRRVKMDEDVRKYKEDKSLDNPYSKYVNDASVSYADNNGLRSSRGRTMSQQKQRRTVLHSNGQRVLDQSVIIESQNPILGTSEGENKKIRIKAQQREEFQMTYPQQAANKSRSRSPTQKLMEKSMERGQDESIAYQIYKKKLNQSQMPSLLGHKQRFQHSQFNMQRNNSREKFDKSVDTEQDQKSMSMKAPQTMEPSKSLIAQPYANHHADTMSVVPVNYNLLEMSDYEIAEAQQKKVDYGKQLREQMAQKQVDKAKKKQEENLYHERMDNEIRKYNYYGKQGGGAPLKDDLGNVNTSRYAQFPQFEQPQIQVNHSDQSPPRRSHSPVGTSMRANEEHYGRIAAVFTPSRNEQIHARPSNQFEDITEDEFNQREQDKNFYRNELMAQINDRSNKKEEEKRKKRMEEMKEDERIYGQLNQMQNEYIRDEERRGHSDARKKVKPIQQPKYDYRSPDRNSNLSMEKREASLGDNISVKEHIETRSAVGGPNQSHVSLQNYNQNFAHQKPIYLEENVESQILQMRQQAQIASFQNQDALEKLRKLQSDIEWKHKQDRIENAKITNDMMLQSKMFLASIRNQAEQGNPTHLSFASRQMDYGFKNNNSVIGYQPPSVTHDSQFQALPKAHIQTIRSVTPNVQGLNFNDGFDRKDDLSKLDDLISKFKEQRLESTAVETSAFGGRLD